MEHFDSVKELATKKGTYVSIPSSSNESFETVDADIQSPLPLESSASDSSNNLVIVTQEDTESDCDESSVRHETFEENVETPTAPQEKSSDELKQKKNDVSCDYFREDSNQHGSCSKKVVKHKMNYFIPNKELAIKEGTYVSTSSSSSNESFETVNADIQSPLPLEYPPPDSSNNLSIVTHEVTDTESDCDESSVRHETFEGNVETPTAPQENSSDELKQKKNDVSCDYFGENSNQHGSCSKKVLKHKIKYFNPAKELAIMRGTYVSTSSSSNESFETVDADADAPTPDSSNNLSIVTHEVTDTESECNDSPVMHKKFKGNVETSTVPKEKSSDHLKKCKKYVCRDYIRGNCCRGDNCKFSHEYNLTHLAGVYTFCHKFQNSTCTYTNCKYVHADVFEERNFYRTGILPPYALAHIKTGDSPPHEPQYLLEDPRQTFSSFNYFDPSSQAQTQTVWPRMF